MNHSPEHLSKKLRSRRPQASNEQIREMATESLKQCRTSLDHTSAQNGDNSNQRTPIRETNHSEDGPGQRKHEEKLNSPSTGNTRPQTSIHQYPRQQLLREQCHIPSHESTPHERPPTAEQHTPHQEHTSITTSSSSPRASSSEPSTTATERNPPEADELEKNGYSDQSGHSQPPLQPSPILPELSNPTHTTADSTIEEDLLGPDYDSDTETSDHISYSNSDSDKENEHAGPLAGDERSSEGNGSVFVSSSSRSVLNGGRELLTPPESPGSG